MLDAKGQEDVKNYRGGSVLGKKTILKSDHFPGCQNKRLTPQIDGAPNYRQVRRQGHSLIFFFPWHGSLMFWIVFSISVHFFFSLPTQRNVCFDKFV